jgi:murein DD-endopeptidase MepM/ murein hydrolase activator NlpD
VTLREHNKENGPEERRAESLRHSKLSIFGLLAVGVICATLLVGFYYGIEVEKPMLEVQDVPNFVGSREVQVGFRARDTGSGIDSIVVSVEQAGASQQIARFDPSGIVHEFSGTFPLSKAIVGLREGPAIVRVDVRDRSLWASTTNVVFPIVVDSFDPSLQLLSAPRAIDFGGVGLFVYKAGDANLIGNGIAIGTEEYAEGRPAALMDSDLLQPDLFAVLVAAPEKESGEWAVFASDVAGHNVRVPVSVEVRSTRSDQKVVSEYASEGALIRLLANLSQELANGAPEMERRNIERFRQDLETSGRKGAIEFVNYLIPTIRESELNTIQKRLAVEVPTPRRWRGEMFTGPFALRVGFGDRIVIGDEQGEFVSWTSQGEVLEPIGDATSVVAPYAGTVRMAGRLGTLGEIVVVDHGAGLSSVFYSLEQRLVFEGAVVTQGQALADIGTSGLHTSKAARMLFLVNGRPVAPALWRQTSGFSSTVDGALNGIKGALGIESSSAE